MRECALDTNTFAKIDAQCYKSRAWQTTVKADRPAETDRASAFGF